MLHSCIRMQSISKSTIHLQNVYSWYLEHFSGGWASVVSRSQDNWSEFKSIPVHTHTPIPHSEIIFWEINFSANTTSVHQKKKNVNEINNQMNTRCNCVRPPYKFWFIIKNASNYTVFYTNNKVQLGGSHHIFVIHELNQRNNHFFRTSLSDFFN